MGNMFSGHDSDEVDVGKIEQFMVTLPDGTERGQMITEKAPDGQTMEFEAPAVKLGEEFPVAFKRGGFGGKPPVDTDLMLAMHRRLEQEEVTRAKAKDLLALKTYDTIVLVDDSGSMAKKDAGCDKSRWEELKETLKLITPLVGCFDKDGLDIYFLNRLKISGVFTDEDAKFKESMSKPPYGKTPLTERLHEIVGERVRRGGTEKPVLLMIFTDGEPDGGPKEFADAMRGVLKDGKINLRCQIMACTGKSSDELKWLDDLDEEFSELDVTDDYLTEKEKAKKAGSTLSHGDWLLKAMLGGVHEAWDNDKKRKSDGDESGGDGKRAKA